MFLLDESDGAGARGGVGGIAGAAWAGFNGFVKVDERWAHRFVGEGCVATVSQGKHELVLVVERKSMGATGGTKQGVRGDLDKVERGIDGNEEDGTSRVIACNFTDVTLFASEGGGGGNTVCDAEAYRDGSVGE